MTAMMAELTDLRAAQAKERAEAAAKASQAREETIRDLLTGAGPTSPTDILAKLDEAGISLDEFERRKDENDRAWRALRTVSVERLIDDIMTCDEERSLWDAAQLKWEIVGRFIDPTQTHTHLMESLAASAGVSVSAADRPKLERYAAGVRAAAGAAMKVRHLQTKYRDLQKVMLRCELTLSRPHRDKNDDAGMKASIERSSAQTRELDSELVAADAALLTAMRELIDSRADLPQLVD